MRLVLLLLIVLAVPAFGYAVACMPYVGPLGMSGGLDVASFATDCLLDRRPAWEHPDLCQALLPSNVLGLASVIAAGSGLVLVAAPILAAQIVGRSRLLMALSFPVLGFFSLVFLSLCTLLQTLILAGGVALLEINLIGSVHPYIVLAIAAIGLAMGFGIFGNAFTMFRRQANSVVGEVLSAEDAPDLHRTITDVAARLNTHIPQNIVVGLEPTFYATTTRTNLEPEGPVLKGQTLYLSLPLLRLLSPDEAKSIIGHELGHFTGKDTVYSDRFAPAFAGLARARRTVTTDEATSIWSWPVVAVIDHLLGVFALPERRIRRERELRADELGASVGSPEAFSSGLAKLSLLELIWDAELHDAVDRIFVGRPPRNLARNFAERTRYDIDHEAGLKLTQQALEHATAHPVDTHPPTRTRIEALGVNADELVEPERFHSQLFPKQTLVHGQGVEAIEERLTRRLENAIVRRTGKANQPEALQATAWALLQARFVAGIVVADGPPDNDRIEAIQNAAVAADNTFDVVALREFIRYPAELPEIATLIHDANDILTEQGAAGLKTLLHNLFPGHDQTCPQAGLLVARVDAELIGTPAPDSEAGTDPALIRPGVADPKAADEAGSSSLRRRRRR